MELITDCKNAFLTENGCLPLVFDICEMCQILVASLKVCAPARVGGNLPPQVPLKFDPMHCRSQYNAVMVRRTVCNKIEE